MKKSVCILLSLMLSACATATMKEGLPHLVGKPIQNAIHYLGYPDDQKIIAGQSIYIWQHQRTYTSISTISTPYSGSAFGTGGGMSFGGETTSVVPVTHNDVCSIRLITDKKGMVIDFDGEGNNGGCSYYADEVGRIIDDAEKAKVSTDKPIDQKGKK